jgi:hypothetical protein
MPESNTIATSQPMPISARQRRANRRTALLLLAIVLLFFFGIIVSRFIDDPVVSIGVVGGAVLLYLVVAIGRHLIK